MKTTALTIILLLTLSPLALAEQRFNPMEGRWETTTSDTELRHDPYNNEWSYERSDSEMTHNPFEDSWEWQESEGDSGMYDYDGESE
jgi:hypothetical protein